MPRMSPEPKRVIQIEGVKFALSPEQFDMLTKKSIKLPRVPSWNDEQRMRGLVLKGLFRKLNGSYVRTKLGKEVLDALKERDNFKL